MSWAGLDPDDRGRAVALRGRLLRGSASRSRCCCAPRCRVFHFDVGDGHFIPPITMGPIVLQSIAPIVHATGGVLDCHLMIETPERHFEQFREAGADSVTVHYEACPDLPKRRRARARARAPGRVWPSIPRAAPEAAAEAALGTGVDFVLCMSIHPGYLGAAVHPEALDRIRALRGSLPETMPIQVDGGVGPDNIREVRDAGANAVRGGARRSSAGRTCRAHTAGSSGRWREPRAGACARRAGTRAGRTHAPVGRGGGGARGRGRRRRVVRRTRLASRRGCGARGGGRAGARRDAVRLARALLASRQHAAVRRRGRRGRRRARGGCGRRPESEGRRPRLRPSARGGCPGRGGGALGGAPPERGVARLDRARAAIRHLQGGDHAGRAGDRPGLSLGLGRGEPHARPRARGRRRTRSPSGWALCGRTTRR